ncbi:cation:proton antiporter [Pseudopontixanthobacter vadosimaris]|uniref:cation:proton antiporter domain-containing protein n=1 Tax=Pseudopontixanthobacter vadosimaris TaxID=2726450 RepID=UPI0014764147|nr:cation:proton antiporter [Pseudopontixanthobacter vadosimaris]
MEHEGAGFLRDGVLMLGFALGFVLVFRRLGLGATLGYLLAGAVVGPHGLGLVGNAESMIGFAEIGIILLLFIVGLELDPARLWRMRTAIFGIGFAQVAACGLAVTAFIYLATDFPLFAALALGLPLGLSSTAQVLPMLQSSGRLRTPFGERAFAILLFQDLSIIVLITIVAALSLNPADADAAPGWQLALMSLVAVGALIAAGRFLLRPLFRLIGNLGEREMFVVAGLFTVIAAAALMEWLGLSTALGAFVAGVMLANTPYRLELEADIEPFRSILLGLFFLAVGMMLDLGAIAENPLFVIGMAVGLIAIKAAIIFVIGRLAGMEWRPALALGLLLSQGGEFAFVLFAQAQQGLLIAPEIASLFGAIVTLSMATTPFLMMATAFIRKPRQGSEQRDAPDGSSARAIVVGYGRFGQTVAQMLQGHGATITLVDRDVPQIDLADDFGSKVFFGDGTRIDFLRQAGAGEADLILFCMDGDQVDAAMLHAVRAAFPQASIMVRTFDRRSMLRIKTAPVQFIVREVRESAIAMGRAALSELGLGTGAVTAVETRFRAIDMERLERQHMTGDLKAGSDLPHDMKAEGPASTDPG